MDGDLVPAGPPPVGVLSDFIKPVNYAPNLIACNIVLLIISTFVVGARIASRTVLTDWRLGWDDLFMVVALVGTAIFCSFVVIVTHYGLGRHIWDVPMSTYTPQYLWWIMATFAACPASYYFVKLSILLFYLRVFQLRANLRYMIYALIAYCTIYYWVAFFAIIGLCNVHNRAWDINVTMNCFGYGKLVFAIGGMDLVADVMVLAFPVPMVLKLRISWEQKVYLLFVFLAGIAASVACAIRIALGVQARGTTDATMAQYHVVTLFCIEHYFALIAGCMPTLGPFFRWLRPSQWRHQKLERADDPEAFQRVWPKSKKVSPDDSLMMDSVDPSTTPKVPSSIYEKYPQSLSRSTKSLIPGLVRSNVYGAQTLDDAKNIVKSEQAQKEENANQTFRASVEVGELERKAINASI